MSRLAVLSSIGLLLTGLVACGWLSTSGDAAGEQTAARVGEPVAAEPLPDGLRHVVHDVGVRNYGKLIYRGSVDLSATIARIQAGERYPHRNDGSVFGNRERRLPLRERGYYREYVHPTEGIDGPGPQRIVVGRAGDWWYTPDHYASFVPLGTEER